MENTNPTDDFVLTAEVEDYIAIQQAAYVPETTPQAYSEVISPTDNLPINGPVDVTEIELQPTDGQEAPQEAPEITQIGDGVYLDANGQGLAEALAAYQEAVSEGVDFGGEAGTWYYQGGAFAFIGA